ncbi:MAG: ABC transporter permease subunit [Lachnospiraceae bacterium]|nr:ABC transporter permease subunit [Lachnospiraceae bacterium]
MKKNKEKLNQAAQEELVSPFKMVVRNFLRDKVALTGVILVGFVFLCCLILPVFFPIDSYYQDVTQANVAPGFGMLKAPEGLGTAAADLSVGSTFSVGVDADGNVYEWGTFPTEKLKKLPTNMGRIKDVSAGLDHVLALNEEGTLFTWGNDRMGLEAIPLELRSGEKIKQIYAGYQVSFALTEEGHLYNWGNSYLLDPKIPKDVQGEIVKFAVNTNLGMVLTKTGEILPLTQKSSAFTQIPAEIQGQVRDIALSDESMAAVLDDGSVQVWGSNVKGTLDVPGFDKKAISVEGGRYHFTLLMEDGTVETWGDDTFGQRNVPGFSGKIVKTTAGYYGSYAIDESGQVYGWGLKGYLFGTDAFGRDVFRRLLEGGRMSMTVGAIAVVISTLIGVLIGGISGYKGGKTDNLLMRFTEIVSSIPFLPFAIILSAILGNTISETQRILLIMMILGLLSWPGIARLVRGSVLAEREQEFVTAAKALGVNERGIVFRHIIPNIITVIIVNATLNFATCMLTESSLSFIGFGVQEPNATWGNMLTGAQNSQVIQEYWWRWVFPSLALGICTISINCVGDGLRDAIDPKSGER